MLGATCAIHIDVLRPRLRVIRLGDLKWTAALVRKQEGIPYRHSSH